MSTLEETTVAGVPPPLGWIGMISDQATEIVNTINFAVLGGVVGFFGIIANIINIIVFVRQGFNDTVNVSLFALACSDLLSLLSLQWINLLRNPLFYNSGVPLIPSDIFYLTSWPHGFFARLTSWITAYITLERCLCVLIPLKVKLVVTPKLVVSVLVVMFLVMCLPLASTYTTCYMGWKFDLAHNRSMLGLLFTDEGDNLAFVTFNLLAYTQMVSFLAVQVFTVILVIKMKEKSKWRTTISNVGQDSQRSSQKRDTKTVNMVIFIAVIYSICYVPFLLSSLTTTIEPEFNIMGRYCNVFLVAWSITFLSDSINSSVNIFVYYKMSTKYRITAQRLLRIS